MSCPDCGADVVAFAVPDRLADALPGDDPAAALCTRCLSVTPLESVPDDDPDFRRVSDAFPREADDGAALACLLALLDSPGLYRRELRSLVEHLERSGTDPFLALDRLGRDDALTPVFDVDRRRTQLEQLV